MPATIRARVLALSRESPPVETGLSHWSSRELARYVTRTAGVSVSHYYVAKLWRDNGLRPHRHGTFKLSRDRSSPRRSPTSSACTWTRPAAPSCCRSMSRVGLRRVTIRNEWCVSAARPPNRLC